MSNMVRRVRAFLLPGEAEADGGFKAHVNNLSRKGLRVIAGVEIAVPVFMLLARYLVLEDRFTWRLYFWQTAFLVAVGFLTGFVARMKSPRLPLRLYGWLSGWLVGAILIGFSLILLSEGEISDHHITGEITTVLLVGVGALPMRPLQTLALGLGMWTFHLIAATVAVRWMMIGAVDPDGTQSLFIVTISLLSAALSAVLYAERRSTYLAHQEALHASDTICRAQSRALLSENAASLGRLAAALSHELNNPIGALTSAVDSLVLLAARQATSPPSELQRLVLLQADLRRSVTDSVNRLRQIVARMQRFTNLDKADVQPADINALVGDVAALLEGELKNGVKVELDLHPLPPLLCRPQQLSAVLSSLLHNAVEATVNGSGHIRVSTKNSDSQVEVRIWDNGRGLRPEELATVFDPGFKISGGRVSTGNWSLFSARQIVREHGGDIRIESAEGKGTTVSVILPRWRDSEPD